MSYTNSKLISYTKLSPNHSGQRTYSIDRITPHCVVGQLSAESICGCFTSTDRQASCNYGIGTDGRVSLCVEEKNRSWCSSSSANDQRAITIECASDTTAPYAMNSKVYDSLINLCADICQRNGKKKLVWLADKDKTLSYNPASDEMVLTVHRWFANKSCPGDWLYNRLGDLASKVTAKLDWTSTTAPTESATTETASSLPAVPFTVRVLIDDLNYRSEPSMNGKVKGQTGKGVFTITAVSDGWGKLKSGAGWIYLENPSYCTVLGSSSNNGATESKTDTVTATTGTQASEFKNLSEKDAAEKIGKLCQVDMKKSSILASVSVAQFILESGYGKSELAQNANNCFGMKCSLSGNTWAGSVWDGTSKYTKQTSEEYMEGQITTITADFRKYASVEDSVADHSAYLNGAMNGSKLRYDGLKGCTDYKKAIQIIKDGGYATSSTYVENICSIIEKYNLTQYDVASSANQQPEAPQQTASADKVIAVAVSEIGYHEKASNASLDDKTANSGTANYTKYARDFDQKYPNWYNGKKNGYAWCDMFVDWCFLSAFGYEAALKLLCQPEKSAGAGCTYSMRYFKSKGQFHTSNPKAGDQIFFGDSADSSSHTGIVEKVDSSKVYTIEGNSSDQVIRRSYALSNSSILGYGRPAYDTVSVEKPSAPAGNADATPATSACPYRVRVSISDLNIRKGPGTDYAKTGKYTGKGVFTIVEEQAGTGSSSGWGKLKSGAGWIALDYTVKV